MDLEVEKQKWDVYRREEERKIKSELEAEVDSQIALFKDKLRQEEEREKLSIQKENDVHLRQYEKDMDDKFERERKALADQYARIRKTVDETEKDRFDFEIEKFSLG